jgi:hypothetical protein
MPTNKTAPTPAAPAPDTPYVLVRTGASYSLHRNGALIGVDAVPLTAPAGRAAVEYTPASRPGEARVRHEMPAHMLKVAKADAAPKRAARSMARAAQNTTPPREAQG